MRKSLAFLALLSLLLSSVVWAAGAWETDAQSYSIRLENAKVRVLDVTYLPGKIIPAHSLRDRLVIVHDAGRIRTEDEAGLKKERDMVAGDISWEKAENLIIENIGTTIIKAQYIEIK